MYVYQVSERDSGKNRKSHIVIKVEEFCLEIRICLPFTLPDTGNIKAISSQ